MILVRDSVLEDPVKEGGSISWLDGKVSFVVLVSREKLVRNRSNKETR